LAFCCRSSRWKRSKRAPFFASRRVESSSQRRLRKAHSCRRTSQLIANYRLRKNPQICFEGPFGEVLRATGPMARANPFRFSTKYQDDETDLLYFGYRYYNASTGRWVSKDPLAEAGGKNLYAYVRNGPVSRIDPRGLVDRTELDILKMILGQYPELAVRLGIPTSLDLLDPDTLGFVQTAWLWFFGNASTQHLAFAAYDPGWKPQDFPHFKDKVAQVCKHCGTTVNLSPPLARVRNLYEEGVYTIFRRGGPGRYVLTLTGQLTSTLSAWGCSWSFAGNVAAPPDLANFDPENPGRNPTGQQITELIRFLQEHLGVGHDFWFAFDGSRSVSAEGLCPCRFSSDEL
jgi:RHS repeat-associated protein